LYLSTDVQTYYYIRRELRITGILDKSDEHRRKWLTQLQGMPQNRIPVKSHHYRPQRRRKIGNPKKRCREQLYLWRRNGSRGAIFCVYEDDVQNNTLKFVGKTQIFWNG